MSAVRLLYSIRRSLFFSWNFFLCCLWVLRGPFPSVCDSFGSKVSLGNGVARWDESILFSLGPFVFYSGCFIRFLLDLSWFSSFFLYQGFTLFLHLFAWIRSALFQLRDVVPSIFSLFSFRSAFLDSCFCLFCPLPFFGIAPWGSWQFSSFVRVSPFRVSSQVLGPLSTWSLRVFILPVFVPALFFVLFFVSLVHPLRLACFGLGPFLRFLFFFSCQVCLYSFLFFSFSPMVGSCPILRDFLRFLIPSLLRVVLFSSRFAGLLCCLYVLLDSTSSLLSRSFRLWLGLIFHCVFLVCLFLLFGIPYHVL